MPKHLRLVGLLNKIPRTEIFWGWGRYFRYSLLIRLNQFEDQSYFHTQEYDFNQASTNRNSTKFFNEFQLALIVLLSRLRVRVDGDSHGGQVLRHLRHERRRTNLARSLPHRAPGSRIRTRQRLCSGFSLFCSSNCLLGKASEPNPLFISH